MALEMLNSCVLCPRKCKVNRYETTGFCGCGNRVKVARAALHFMEEPCISGKNGSGTIFFSGCNLKCCYCQNYELSHDNFGKDISVERLANIMLELQDKGANNINLVTAVMYIPQIILAIDSIRDKLRIPIVYNCGGYENKDVIKMLSGYIDIYLCDIKYYDDSLGRLYSKADNYFENAISSVDEMIKQKGRVQFFDNLEFDNENAIMKSGVIIRHLVLPGHRKDSIKIIDELSKRFDNKDYILSIMNQYTPNNECDSFKELNRKLTSFEYDSVVNHALNLGIENAYIQDKSSVGKEYTPEFKLQGV